MYSQTAELPIKKASKNRSNWKFYKYYYLLIAPGLLYFILFHYVPMAGIIIAFKDFKLSQGIIGSEWAGLKWFHLLFAAPDFWVALRNTILISFYKLIFGFPAPIVLALLLNEVTSTLFKRVVQTVVYFPHFVSWVVLGGLMFTLLSPNTGIFTLFGSKSSPLMEPDQFRSLLVWSEIWKEVGWGTVIYLAAITGINPELYEAAKIDGASRFQQVRYITLPSISGTIILLMILKAGHLLNAGFDQVFILYHPLVYNVADILDTYVYRVGLTLGRFSIAAAAGLFKSVVGLLMLLFTNWLARRLSGQGLW
ncbi:ABC transporter permease [Paenibacillus thalictri]|uniref:Sugar ABC transporter permease n=1 Tax=Paenibacillus thalictri TaxID=2527873 RepID=A0A4Q9DXU2_9BACL|nr:ABC transporter permease subunit [Paenibacillus thalictri]TBL81939.1 sugar ABC transporter permease [Paenibacillus thalictri]